MIAILGTTAAFALHLLQAGAAPAATPEAPRPMVLTLGSERSAAPCNTFWEKGSAPDAQHAWIDLHATSDGGRTWRVVKLSKEADAAMHLHGILDPSDDSLGASIQSWFISPTRGWLIVPRKEETLTWETDDGGTTFRSVPGFDVTEMHFADASHGLALLVNRDQDVEPMLTANAGETWTRCGVKYSDAYFDSLFLLGPRRGWAWVGAPKSQWDAPWRGGKSDVQLRHGIMRTNDGGCHWRGEWNDQQLTTECADLYFLNEKQGWLAGGYKGGLYHTTDGGASWKPLPLRVGQTEVKGVFFADVQHGWMITESEELFETRDAGRTWRNVARGELFSRLDDLMNGWERWRIGKLYGMLTRSGCFTPEQLQNRLEH